VSRFRIFTLFAALLALATAFSACGGGGSSDPQTIIDEATLQGIESGNVDLSLGIDVSGSKGGHLDVGLAGPFQSESEAEYPELDMTASAKGSIGGEKVDFEGGLTLLGNKAYVGYAGTEYEVDPTTFNFVRTIIKRRSGGKKQSTELTACQEAAAELQISNFVENPKGEGSADVGGTSTTKVSGDLDVTRAPEAVIELSEDPACAEQLKAAGPLPNAAKLEQEEKKVQEAVKSAHVVLYVGDDHIVRRITAQVTVEPPKGSGGGGAKSAEIELDLTLTGVNEEQTISAPSNSKPLSNLFVKLGINPIELLSLLQGSGGGLNGGSGGLSGLLQGFAAGGTQ
jgi:hypothetical protein